MGDHVRLVVHRVPSGRSERMQVFPGLLGEIMSVNGRGETVVLVDKQDGLRALDRAERRYVAEARTNGASEDEIARSVAMIRSKRKLFRSEGGDDDQ